MQYLKKEKQKKKKLDKEEAHIKPVKSHKGFSVSSVNGGFQKLWVTMSQLG